MEHLKGYFARRPVIAGVRNAEQLEAALTSQVIALFILSGDILQLPGITEKARDHDKLVFLHIDLIEGIGRDSKGVMFLAHNDLCEGIVSTKSNLIQAGKRAGLLAIQRLFLLDSAALRTGEHMLEHNRPDAVEILPGIAAPYFIDDVGADFRCPVIAGGLINHRSQVEELLEAGVMAVSTSNRELWDMSLDSE